MNAARLRWHVHADTALLAAAVADFIRQQADQAIKARNGFLMVLAGGSTPRGIYEHLARCSADWKRWVIFFGDERCLPAGDPRRNDAMAAAAWLAHVPIPGAAVHPIPAELGPRAGAERYGHILANVDDFDLVLLGLGEDGHTASLFPGACLGVSVDSADVLGVYAAAKPPAERVSLSARRLSRTRRLLLVATGKNKRQALARLRNGAEIPARAIRPGAGVDVHMDYLAHPAGTLS